MSYKSLLDYTSHKPNCLKVVGWTTGPCTCGLSEATENYVKLVNDFLTLSDTRGSNSNSSET